MENVQDIYPLSPMQQGMLFHSLYAPESGNYTEQMSAVISGPLNISAFREAWQRVLDRHDVLRTAFIWEDVDQPLQVVHETLPLPFEELDWSGLNGTAQDKKRTDLRHSQREEGFELTTAPLLRIKLIKMTEQKHAFIFTYHHILLDGWAMPLVLGEVFQHYDCLDKGRALDLRPAQPFRNYIAWLQEQNAEDSASFWKNRLQNFYSPTALVVDHKYTTTDMPYLKKRYMLSKSVSNNLHQLAKDRQITLNTIVQGAWALLLAIYNRTDDVVFGATVSGRPVEIPGIETMVGLFINTLPVRASFNYDDSIITFLKKLHLEQNETRVYEYSPLVEIKKVSELAADQPLFETLFVFENYPVDDAIKQQQSELSISDVHMFERSNFPLTIVTSSGMPIAIEMAFDTGRLSERSVDRMAGHLDMILKNIAANPERRIKDISLLKVEEEEKILNEWNATEKPIPENQTIVSLFEKIVGEYPDNIALVHDGQKWTYKSLNNTANRWARLLQSRGVARGEYVALCLPRSMELIAATLAILKCGAAYVPIDSNYPVERIDYMINDAGSRVLISDHEIIKRIKVQDLNIIQLDELNNASAHTENIGENIDPADAAYIIYTSGSTGKPKGVLLHHRGLINTIRAQQQDFQISSESRGLQFASYSFDAAVSEVFSSLLSGAAFYIIEKETILSKSALTAFLNDNRISFVTFPPSLLAILTDEDFPFLKTVISVGEACSLNLAKKWMDRCRFFNGYGPTEATIGCVWGQIKILPEDTNTAPIGRPITNDQIYIVDSFMHLQPVGVPGELCIASPGLAYGYLHRKDLTSERFIANPFAPSKGSRIYRSGDLARWLEDGSIEFIGRIDFQVKIRGNRIELGEIESAILEDDYVKEAAVVAIGEDPQTKRLAAYLIPASPSFDLENLRGRLAEHLPEYMQPAAFTILESFPLTHNGKVNRRALPQPDFEQHDQPVKVSASTPVQELLLSLWQDVLGIENISINDNFFHLGGHSLLATQLVSRIRDAFDVEVPLRKLFEQPTIAFLAQLIGELKQTDRGYSIPVLEATERPDAVPLSFAQQRLWFLDQLQPGGVFYNIPAAFRIEGDLNVQALEKSLQTIAQRHEILRTTFADEHGKPVQVIHDADGLPFSHQDFSAMPEAEQEERIKEAIKAGTRHVFNLASGPLWIAALYTLNDRRHIFTITLHHTIADGWSMGVFISEMAELYQAFCLDKPSPLPALDVQYADYAIWQQKWLQGDILEKQLDFWQRTLGKNPPVLELPYDHPRPAVQTFNGAALSRPLPTELARRIRSESASMGVTPYMFMLAAFQTLLYRYSRQDEIIVGSPIANRNYSGTEKLIGFFINNLILKSDFSDTPDFENLLFDVRDRMLDAYAHQDVPFEQIVDALVTQRDTSHSPIFQVMFVYQNLPKTALDVSDIRLEALENESTTAKFDLSVTISPAERMALEFEYNTDLFERATIENMMQHYENLLSVVLDDMEIPVDEIDYLGAREKETILTHWNDTDTPYKTKATVHGNFEEMTLQNPDGPAVVFQSAPGATQITLSYKQLNMQANRLAHYLISKNVSTEDLVGISMQRSPEMIISMLAVLKCGAAYVPIDPGYPKERINYMIQDSGLSVIITQENLLGQFSLENIQLITADNSDQFIEYPATNPGLDISSDNLAYVIYTSGSTGNPKGTLLHHRGACNLAALQKQKFETGPGSRILQFASLSFDAATWEFLMALLSGSALVLTSGQTITDAQALVNFLAEQKITTITLPPSVLAVWPDTKLPQLRTIITAGEAVSGELVKKWGVDRSFFNAYGPTETTVCATMHRCQGEYPSAPPIGTANPNFKTYVLDSQLNPVPIGIPGELCVSGTGIARGYYRQPAMTAEKFIPNPFGTVNGDRLYRTGDLVRMSSDGNLEFMGRIDHQVKVRGFRIELGEIEAALSRSDQVIDQYVTVWDDTPGEQLLTAYCVPADTEKTDLQALKAHLKQYLPEYMLPSDFIMLEAMPLTANGKVDKNALPKPERDRSQIQVEYVAPRNPVEKTLAEITRELLHQERVGVFDNFFDLGGHSLLATQFMSRIRQSFDIELPLLTLFEKPTISELADEVEIAKASGIKAKPQIQKIDRAGRSASRRPSRRSKE